MIDVPASTLSVEELLRTAFVFRETRILLTAAELGVFTELGKGPRSGGQLCRTLRLDEAMASVFFDALVSLGLLERDGQGARAIYLNTREGTRMLDGAAENSLDGALRQAGRSYGAWNELTTVLRRPHRTAPARRVKLALRKFLEESTPAPARGKNPLGA